MAKVPAEEIKFQGLLNIIATQCNYQLTDPVIAMYDQSLSHYGYARVNAALAEIFKSLQAGARFPSVNDICQQMGLVVSDKARAVECANLIFWTFAKWKLNWADRDDFEQMFCERIGTYPWAVIQRMGGYRELYREWDSCSERSALRAQVREAALALLEIDRQEEYAQIGTTEKLKLGGRSEG